MEPRFTAPGCDVNYLTRFSPPARVVGQIGAGGICAVGIVDVTRLKRFGLFDGLSHSDLVFIAENCSEMTVASGSILIREGQVGRDIYLLEEGSVRVFRGDLNSPREIAVLQSPTIVGELALLDSARIRTSSVSALSELRLLSIPISTFLVFVGAYPSVKEKLRQVIATRR